MSEAGKVSTNSKGYKEMGNSMTIQTRYNVALASVLLLAALAVVLWWMRWL